MTKRLLLLAALLAPVQVQAQAGLPVVRAGSREVTIVDGNHLKKNYWYVMPERSPEVYHVEIPRRPHKVTFITDRESISFDVSFGSTHRFMIRLDDGRETVTEIRAVFKPMPEMSRSAGAPAGPPSIRFTLGDNDKIYIQGRLNGGTPLSLQVDLGAGGALIKKASVPKGNLTFDDSITLRNSDGVNVVPASRSNLLAFDGVNWRSVHVAVADNVTRREDGIVGNTLFLDKVLEIDFDRMRLTIHDSLPDVSSGWTREDIVLDGVVPFVRGRLRVGESIRDGWFMLDTGAYTSILHSEGLSKTTKLTGEMRRMLGPLGGSPVVPVIQVAGRTFADVNYSARSFDGDSAALGLLGNDLLKRFNLILDNQQGAAYFRPSRTAADAWRNPDRWVARVPVVAVLLACVAVIWRMNR